MAPAARFWLTLGHKGLRYVAHTACFWLTPCHKGLQSLEHQNQMETQPVMTSSKDSVSNPLLSLPSISPSRQSRLPLL